MSRLQLALNVEDIDAAVRFYSVLFDTPPAKRRPGYANFAVEQPPLKLVLFESPGRSGTLNHLGVERDSSQEVASEAERLEAAGLSLRVEGEVACCYARQDKHWVSGPDGQEWENYVVLGDDRPDLEGSAVDDAPTESASSSGGCCGAPTGTSSSATACCVG